jgi:CHASE3 domain sensor protein
MVRFRRRLIGLLVPLTILAVLGAAAVLWLDQQSARARLAEAQLQPALAKADAAEARAARAEEDLELTKEQLKDLLDEEWEVRRELQQELRDVQDLLPGSY